MIDNDFSGLIRGYARAKEKPELSLAQGDINKANNNFKEAILDYSHYLEFNTDRPLPYFLIADCYYHLSNNDAAIKNYEIGRTKLSGNIPHDFLMNYAGALLENGQNEKALLLADELIEQNKNSPIAHILKGQILLELDKYDTAFYYLTKAIEIDDKQWQAWATRIKINYCLEDYHRTVHDFKNAYLINPNLPAHYHTTYAFALQNIGRSEESKKEFEKAKLLGDPEAILICDKFKS